MSGSRPDGLLVSLGLYLKKFLLVADYTLNSKGNQYILSQSNLGLKTVPETYEHQTSS